MLPVILALVSSVFFGFSNVAMQRGLLGLDHFTGLLVNLTTSSALLWGYLLSTSDRIELLIPTNLVFAGVGVLVPGVSRLCVIHGIGRLGISVTSAAVSCTPLFAIVFAVFVLGEIPTLLNLLGALLIVVGIVFISWRGPAKIWRVRDLLLPLAAAFLFALRDNLVRFGLLITRSPVLAGAIAASSSAVTMGTVYLASSGPRRWPEATPPGFLWFGASGFAHFLSYIFMFTALGLDKISVVTPIVSCFSLFVLPLAYFLLKGVEQITLRKVSATVLVVLGVLLISWEKL
jgi:drug/metabolite transporter (DMT)-like permease